MTQNEKIAKVMNWRLVNAAYEFNGSKRKGYVDEHGALVCTRHFDPEHDMHHAKLLQARIVDDGYIVDLEFDKSVAYQGGYMTTAGAYIYEPDKPIGLTKKPIAFVGRQTESSAIVALFCKVYKIA
jgi:hypothetical protein